MATVKKTIFIKVVTYSPKDDDFLIIDGATINMSDKGSLEAKILTKQPLKQDANKLIPVEVEYDSGKVANLKPAFSINVPDNARHMLTGNANDSVKLPETWQTHHEAAGKTLDINKHTSSNTPFLITVGLYAQLTFSATDHHPSGIRNPMAIAEKTLDMTLTDEDWTTCRWMNPEDVLIGFASSEDGSKNIVTGQSGPHPYYTLPWPIAKDYDSSDKTKPHAWWEPPGLPISHLGGGSFPSIKAVAAAPDGMVIVTDGNWLYRFYPDGTLANKHDLKLHFTEKAVSLSVDRDHTVFVGINDTVGKNSIEIYDLNVRESQFDRSFDSYNYRQKRKNWTHTSGEKVFGTIVDIAFVEGPNQESYLAVLDKGDETNSVKGLNLFSIKYASSTPRTDIVWQDNAANGAPATNGFTTPESLTACRHRLFVADSGQHRVRRFLVEANNKLKADGFWGKNDKSAGSAVKEFNKPGRLMGDTKNNAVYVFDRDNKRIARIDGDNGDWLHQWKPNPLPVHGCVDLRGEIYTVDSPSAGKHNGQIQRWTTYNRTNGSALAANADPTTFGLPWQDEKVKPNLVEPSYVHVDQSNNLWVSDENTDKVHMWELKADKTRDREPNLTLKDNLIDVRGLATDSNGNLFVAASAEGKIYKYSKPWTGSGTVLAPALNAGAKPSGIAVFKRDGKDMLAVADPGNDEIVLINLTDNSKQNMKPPKGGSFQDPFDVAANDEGDIIALDTGHKRLCYLPKNLSLGDDSLEITLNQPGLSPDNVKDPKGVSFDADGHLLITDTGNHRIFHLTLKGKLIAWWDFTHLARHKMRSTTYSGLKGKVTLSAPKSLELAQTYENRGYTKPTAAMTLTVTDKDGKTEVHNLKTNHVLMVDHNAKVDNLDALFSQILPRAFYPELAQMLILRSPRRAVMDKNGVLYVADTGNQRVRAMQTRAHMKLNLVKLDERFPDISLRTKTTVDWTDDLHMKLSVWLDKLDGDDILYEDASKNKALDYKGSVYRKDYFFNSSTRFHEVVYTMHWMRKIFGWLKRHTHGGTVHKWPKPDENIHFKIDARNHLKDTSFYSSFTHKISLVNDISGKGRDTWDTGVISHETGHWFSYSVPTRCQWAPISNADKVDTHGTNKLIDQPKAVIEGYANYIALSFDDEYHALDRIRGNRLGNLNQLTVQKSGIKKKPYLAPNQNLENEGFFGNTLYQLHRLLMQPGVGFADHPSYWHGYNHMPPANQKSAYAETFIEAFARLPKPVTAAKAKKAVETYFQAFQSAWKEKVPADLQDPLQAILELNNLLMPKLTWHQADGSFAPGAEITGKQTANKGDKRKLAIKLLDYWQQPLKGHNVVFEYKGSTPTNNPAVIKKQGASRTRGAVVTNNKTQVNAITDNNGIAAIEFTVPAGLAATVKSIQLIARYTSDFLSDTYFTNPKRGDNWTTTERALYLRALRLSSEQPKDRISQSLGATSSRILIFDIS